jgi:perosamine synthetase
MSDLALLGGEPVRNEPFPAYKTVGAEEQAAVHEVIESGVLSKFLGAWSDDFLGGPQVRAFEDDWAAAFGARHAIAVNSCTSGLYAAVGAAAIEPGDEVIVSPYTMSASTTAALVFNGVPVFADIDPDTYTLDPASIRERITERTRAIIVVHLFGQAADMDPIMAIAEERGLMVIEDCAQAPFAHYKGRPVGTLGHMGVFSLNYHKHIHTGEGGMITTNDERLCERCRLIRNHAESVVEDKGVADIVNMIGFNFRLGEIEAAIGREQLKKGPELIARRQDNVRYLEERISNLAGLSMPVVREGGDHVYYVHPLRYDDRATGVSRDALVGALRAELPETKLREGEGALIGGGYVKPIYLTPLYQKRVAFGRGHWPFVGAGRDAAPDYGKGLCPNTEEAHERTLITHELMRPPMTRADLDDVATAFRKVFDHFDELRDTPPPR